MPQTDEDNIREFLHNKLNQIVLELREECVQLTFIRVDNL